MNDNHVKDGPEDSRSRPSTSAGLDPEALEGSRWRAAQSKEDGFWKRDGVLDGQMERVLSRYAAPISDVSKCLGPDPAILDVGCGPTCAGRLFEVGRKTYLDPLMDSYVKTYGGASGTLPEGEYICATAENIPRPDESFECAICVNALDHMIDPAKALSEIVRILNRDGTFVLGIFLHPRPIAAARMFIEKVLPWLREEAHPYSFALPSIRRLLQGFFEIEREIRVYRKTQALFPSLHREDWLFICSPKPDARSHQKREVSGDRKNDPGEVGRTADP